MAITTARPRANALRDTGNFWWIDLQAADVPVALDFYGRTLGWSFRDSSEGADFEYQTALVGDLQVAGIGSQSEAMRASGMPSTWTSYVFVDDVDAVCARVPALGGTVAMGPMDVMDQGRMALVLDPTGAAMGLWQPRQHRGADAVNQPGTFTWVELYSSDVDAARRFYGELLGWTCEATPDATSHGETYWTWLRDGAAFAGMMPKPAEMGDAPDCWTVYFGVADVEAAALEVRAAGGTILWGPMQTGPGRSIGVVDPQGAALTYMQLDEWPTD